ncbi:signal recognition particle-docking protein FtsY [Phaeovibrio sulfidiphilus]|uniref:Signal recognition particle receptor FtsY n=1 Tax=Phaeovibrio sulfidiphilus TaxID=1220600 RepID=A0A8J6YLV5_9PROT|nr:signal recognition particle-docking protein FtsY [Phaeovibrio sulfidiphilus]
MNDTAQRQGFLSRLFGPRSFDPAPAAGAAAVIVPALLSGDPVDPATAGASAFAYSTERPKRWDSSRGLLGNILGPVAFQPPARIAAPAATAPLAGPAGTFELPPVLVPPSVGTAPAAPSLTVPAPAGPSVTPAAAPPAAGPAPAPLAPAAPPPAAQPEDTLAPAAEPVSFFVRLREGLGRTAGRLAGGINSLLTERKLDAETLEDLEDLLITGDLGTETASKLVEDLSRSRFGKEVSAREVREFFADGIARVLEPVARPLEINPSLRPHVILVVGVNGSGKTTTIGKIAHQLVQEGRSVMLAAGDTFRAAAVEQLKIWGERTNSPVVARDTGADAAGLAYEALEKARAEGVDVLLIDTAGRLHNKSELMEELKKVVRVLRKIDPVVPHTVLQVLDATVGQNAHQQVKIFSEMVDVNGLVMTKLDGTAKGGVVVSLAEKFGLPVHYVGVGEGAEDLRPFAAQDFARSLMDLERLH